MATLLRIKHLAALFLSCILLFAVGTAQPYHFDVEVEQQVSGSNLLVDVYLQRTDGPSYALASSNFSFFMTPTALNLGGSYIDHSQDGPWDVQTRPVHYFDLSTGRGSNYLVLNINSKSGTATEGYAIPDTRTRVGRLVVPIVDPAGFNTLTWRTGPIAITAWDLSEIQDHANFVDPAPNFPLCSTPARPQIVSGSGVLCPGGEVTLSTGYAGVTEWYRDGSLITGQNTSTLVASQAGNYTAISKFHSCASEVSEVFTLANFDATAPVVTAATATSICAGDQVVLQSNLSGAHVWYRDGNLLTGQAQPSLTVTETGSYTARREGPSCLSSLSAAVAVNVTPIISPLIAGQGGNYLCAGGSITITSNYVGDHDWYLNNNLIQTGGASVTTSQAGEYRAMAHSTCGVVPATVTILPASVQQPLLGQASTEICLGEAVSLSSDQPGEHVWYRSGVSIPGANGPTYQATQPGSYTAAMKQGSCLSAPSAAITLAERVIPSPVLSTSANTVVCEGDQVLILSSLVGTHAWYRDNVELSETGSELVATASGAYTARYLDGVCRSAPSAAILLEMQPAVSQPVILINGNTLVADMTDSLQWYRDGAPIPGAIQKTLETPGPGLYTVRVENECGAATSEPVDYQVTSVVDPQRGFSLNVYPNPYAGRTAIHCQLERTTYVVIEVLNMVGQRVAALQDGPLEPGAHSFPFGSEVQGIGTYTLSVRLDGITYTRKIIELTR